ncbi:MAG: prolyl oligopeptidase family serine peptidase [Chitinophagaceae bacterium]
MVDATHKKLKDIKMKYFFLFFSLNITVFPALAQKKIIDSSVFNKWPSLQNPAISSDGKYVVYTIDKMPLDNYTLVIQAADNKWKKEIVAGSDAHFTQDGQKLIYKSTGDSLCLWQLGTERCEYYPHVHAYQLVMVQKKEWLVLQISNEAKELQLRDLTGSGTKLFTHVSDYIFSKDGKSLLLQTEEQYGGQTKNRVQWINWEKGESQVLWESDSSSMGKTSAGSFAFDTKGEQAVFVQTQLQNRKTTISIWYYKVGMKHAEEKANAKTTGILEGVEIGSGKFSRDGKRLFFDLSKPAIQTRERTKVMVDIWSYTDDKLQEQQLREATAPITYKCVINLDNNQAILLQAENEHLYDSGSDLDDYALLTTTPCYGEEANLRLSCRVPLYLVNTRDGSRQLVKDGLVYSGVNGISPDGKYVLCYDHIHQAYFSYKISSGKTINISQNIPFSVCDKAHARAGLPSPYNIINNWLPGNKGLIIYDEYDIWQIDPVGIRPPICLTKGYGRANGIILRITEEGRVITESQVMLTAFRPSDKSNGFFRLDLTKPVFPELLTMGSYLYYWPYITGLSPLKAVNDNTWLVQRMSASEAPDYFATSNFKTFQRLSNVQPQKDYNWLTSDLHEWTMYDGKKSQGILYKPENFDPHKKYPVIFYFYQEKSDELNMYLIPEVTGSHINIPHFVSNGYLVFVPDIHYTIGEVMESIYNSVVSAARYLLKYPWIDSTKMGMQGHSFGGYEVNALITKTNMFAAAAEAAGPTDFVSGYGSVLKAGNSNQFQYETGQNRIKATLWQKPDLYVKNSPIFYADKVNTPLLIMHCKEDGAVPFEQGLEWFTGLRRLGKPAWMLQYDVGGHQIGGKEAEDYTIRLMQFFDHYLKDAPAPKWMTQGITAKLKGIESRYELDSYGSCGKDCKVCKEWNDKYKKDPVSVTQQVKETEARQ